MALVLDASAALSWLIQRADPLEARLSDAILQWIEKDGALVPPLWYSEVANGILVAERKGVVAASLSIAFLSQLNLLPVRQDAMAGVQIQGSQIDLARRHNLSAYDACYLELAQRAGAQLATFDRRLAAASRQAGIRIFGDPE